MPINPKLKLQLESMTMDDAYRAGLIAQLENAPAEVQNLWMSNNDYTRNANALKAEQQEWKKKADNFYDTSNASISGWKAEVAKVNDELAAAKAKLATLEGGGGAVRECIISINTSNSIGAVTNY